MFSATDDWYDTLGDHFDALERVMAHAAWHGRGFFIGTISRPQQWLMPRSWPVFS